VQSLTPKWDILFRDGSGAESPVPAQDWLPLTHHANSWIAYTPGQKPVPV